jgi:hypothetical protein
MVPSSKSVSQSQTRTFSQGQWHEGNVLIMGHAPMGSGSARPCSMAHAPSMDPTHGRRVRGFLDFGWKIVHRKRLDGASSVRKGSAAVGPRHLHRQHRGKQTYTEAASFGFGDPKPERSRRWRCASGCAPRLESARRHPSD